MIDIKNTKDEWHLVERLDRQYVSYCENYTCIGDDNPNFCVCIVANCMSIDNMLAKIETCIICKKCLNHPKHQLWLLKKINIG